MWAEAAGAAAPLRIPNLWRTAPNARSIEIAVWLAGDSTTRVRPACRRAASVDGATMGEKAAEGNVAYFAEFPSEELDRKLRRHRDEDERTLLHIAAAAGQEVVLEFLLQNGAPVDAEEGRAGKSALRLAVEGGHGGCVAQLLQRGANISAVAHGDGATPMLMAQRLGHGEIQQAMLRHKLAEDEKLMKQVIVVSE